MLRLYCAPRTISVAAAIALNEAGLGWEPVPVDFAAAEQTGPAYRAVNPKGRVPALDTGRGIVTETGAILELIAALAPQAALVPADPLAAARMRETMYYLASTMHVNHAHKMRGGRWATQEASFDDMRARVAGNMAECCAHLSDHCRMAPFVLGDRLSLADPWLYTISTWLPGDGVDMAAYPKLTAFMDAMSARASVRAVRDIGLL